MAEPARQLENDTEAEGERPSLSAVEGGGQTTPERGDLSSVQPDETEQEEASKLPPEDQTFGYDAKTKKQIKFNLTRRRLIFGGGVAGLLIGGGASIMFAVAGPLQLIHLSQVLEKNFRSNHLITEKRYGKFAKYIGARDTASTRLTLKGRIFYNFTQKKFAANGIKLTSSPKGLPNFEIDPKTYANGKYADLTPTNQRYKIAKDLGIEPTKIKTTIGSTTQPFNIAGNELTGSEAGKVLRGATNTLDEGGLLSAVRLRTLKNAFGVPKLFSPFKKLSYGVRARLEIRTGWLRQARQNFREQIKSRLPTKLTTSAESSMKRLKQFGESPAGKALSLVSLGIEVLCQIKIVIGDIPKVNWGYVVAPSMDQATTAMAVGSEIMAAGVMGEKSEVSLDEVAARVSSLKDNQGKSVWEGKALNALANGDEGKGEDLKPEYAQAFSPLNNEEFLRQYVGESIASLGAGTMDIACSAPVRIFNVVAGLALTIASFGSFTAGKLAAVGGKAALFAGMTIFLSNKAIDFFTTNVVEAFSGAEGGNLLAYGSRATANLECRSRGCVELSTQEASRVQREADDKDREEYRQRPVFARLFDAKDYRSATSIAMRNMPDSPGEFSQNIASILLNPAQKLAALFAISFPNAQAAGQYEYAMPLYGMPSTVFDDPNLEDPYANAEEVAKVFEKGDYIEKAKKCFGVKIFKGPEGWETGQEDTPNPAEESYMKAGCNDTSNNDWRRVMMFVFDNSLLSSLSCYTGSDEKECTKLGFGGSSSTQTPNNPPTTGLTSHPNLGGPTQNGYYLLPDAPNGEYQWNGGTPTDSRYGSKALVDTIYTVAIRWYQKYPQNKLIIGDLNAREGHLSHKTGIDVDIFTVGAVAANTSGDPEKSKELARMFADTNVIQKIFYNDSSVEQDFNDYVANNHLKGHMEYYDGHEDHFHVRILSDYALLEGGQP